MSEKYKFSDPDGLYFVTSTVIDWIDLFTRKELRYVIIDSLKYCQENKGLVIHAWCIMPSHLHLIVSSNKTPLSAIMRDFKKFTNRTIIKEVTKNHESRREWLLNAFANGAANLKRNSNYKIWKDGNHPKLLDSNRVLDQKLDYIHDNPVEAEFVDKAEHYSYSSARDYAGIMGLLDIDLID